MRKIITKILFIAPALFAAVAADAAPGGSGRVAASPLAAAGTRAPYMVGTSTMSVAVPTIADAVRNQQAADRAANDGLTGTVARAAGDTTPSATAGISDADLADAQAAKDKCLANNVGMGGVFIWANKDARNAPNYLTTGIPSVAMLTEDVSNPANNTCFVRVELASTQSGVNLAGMPYAYFAENDTVTCGSWVSKSAVEEKILAASSTSRTLGTIGGAVAGAGIGFMGTDFIAANTVGTAPDSAWHHQGHLADDTTDKAKIICSNLAYDANRNGQAWKDVNFNGETCNSNTNEKMGNVTPGHSKEKKECTNFIANNRDIFRAWLAVEEKPDGYHCNLDILTANKALKG
jgi:hypothetical protein